jgi:hypothetical protein
MSQAPRLRRLRRDEPAQPENALPLPAHDGQVEQLVRRHEKEEPAPNQRPPAPARREPYGLD